MNNTDSPDRAALAVAVMMAAGVKPSIETRVKGDPDKWYDDWAAGRSVEVENVEVYPDYDTADGRQPLRRAGGSWGEGSGGESVDMVKATAREDKEGE